MLDELINAVGVKDLSNIQEMLLYVVGSRLVVVSNMLGILSLDQNKIEIKSSKHQKAIILGEMLEVLVLNKNDITISGRIHSVSYERL